MLRNLRLINAEFRERIRSPGTHIFLGVNALLVLAEIAGVVTFQIDNGRPVCNTAWSVANSSAVAIFALSLIGFYFLRGRVERDADLGIGALIILSGVTKKEYLFCRFFSNVGLLLCVGAMQLLATPLIQLAYGEDRHWNAGYTLAIYLIIVLPAIASVAALAVAFDAIRALRGALGSCIYFVFWLISLTLVVKNHSTFVDWTGMGVLHWYLLSAAGSKFASLYLFVRRLPRHAMPPFSELAIHSSLLAGRIAWLALSIAVVYLVSYCFDGFLEAEVLDHLAWGKRVLPISFSSVLPRRKKACLAAAPKLTAGSTNIGSLLFAELRMALRGNRWWWWTAVFSIVVFSLLAQPFTTSSVCLIAAWLLPLPLWAQISVREHTANTAELLRSYPSHNGRRLMAMWITGMVIAWLCGAGTFCRLLLSQKWESLFAIGVGAAFISSLAIALGVYSKGSKLFEAIYIVLIYVGPLHGDSRLDFTFSSLPYPRGNTIWHFGAAALLLLAGAYIIKQWRD